MRGKQYDLGHWYKIVYYPGIPSVHEIILLNDRSVNMVGEWIYGVWDLDKRHWYLRDEKGLVLEKLPDEEQLLYAVGFDIPEEGYG